MSRNSRSRSHSNNNSNNAEHEWLNRGGFGIVYRPPQPCQGLRRNYTSDAYVGKVTTFDEIQKESDAAIELRRLDPHNEYSLYMLDFCRIQPPANRADFTYQAIYSYGGQNLRALTRTADGRRANLLACIQGIQNFLPYLLWFNRRFLHMDLHFKNLVLGEDGIVRMIDFATMKSRAAVFSSDILKLERQMAEKGLNHQLISALRHEIYTLAENDTDMADIHRLYRSIRAEWIDTPEARELIGVEKVDRWLATYTLYPETALECSIALDNLPLP
jgi:hypothetical protein